MYGKTSIELPEDLIQFKMYNNPKGNPSVEGKISYRGSLNRKTDTFNESKFLKSLTEKFRYKNVDFPTMESITSLLLRRAPVFTGASADQDSPINLLLSVAQFYYKAILLAAVYRFLKTGSSGNSRSQFMVTNYFGTNKLNAPGSRSGSSPSSCGS